MKTQLVTNISQLVTLAGPARPRVGPEMCELAIIEDAAMLIRDGRIAEVGRRNEISAPPNAELIDAEGRAVLPGFVDAHTHFVFGGDRLDDFEARASGATYEQIAERGGGIRSTVKLTRAATDEALLASAQKHAGWMMRCGTTTAEAKSGYGLTVEDELKILRVLRRIDGLEVVPTFLGAHGVPDEFKGRSDEYVSVVVNEMLPAVAREKLAEFCDVFCEHGYFDIKQSRRVLTAARVLGLHSRMHVDQLTNSGGAKLAAELGAKTADHLECTEADGIEAMRAAKVQPVLLPGSVYALGSQRYPKARAMIEAGLGVVLATDFNPGSSPSPSMPMMMSLATTQMKMTPAEAIVASTINAAFSLNRGDRIGSLEVGKKANFVITEGADYRELSYYFGVEQIRATFIRGARIQFAA